MEVAGRWHPEMLLKGADTLDQDVHHTRVVLDDAHMSVFYANQQLIYATKGSPP